MIKVRRGALVLIALSPLVAACGGAPPEKEIHQAQMTVDLARAAGARQYAREEFAAAEQALKNARAAVDQRDYRLALNNALDSRERAQNALKEAADSKTKARAEAERAIAQAAAAVDGARDRLKAAEAAHVSGRTLASLRRAIADSDAAVQKARAALDAGEYSTIADAVSVSTASLERSLHELDTRPSPARRRR